jgi:hypothetical protein
MSSRKRQVTAYSHSPVSVLIPWEKHRVMKSLRNLRDQQNVFRRIAELSPDDRACWGYMSVHQMVCHLDDSYKCALGEKTASAATGVFQRTVLKFFALKAPMQWPRGVPTLPEVEQGKGGSLPVDFLQDVASLRSTLSHFCEGLPAPSLPHPIFGKMTAEDWMRWGYLHADHHLRQFGR